MPMMTLNFAYGENGINIYLYDTCNPCKHTLDTCTAEMYTVKENKLDSWPPSLSNDQTMMVYTEGKKHEPFTIMIYDLAAKKSIPIPTTKTKDVAYFNNEGKILFLDFYDRKIKRMDTNGENITTIATSEFPYSFSVFWLSPARERIVAAEYKQSGDYLTTHYTRLVLMNSDGTGRKVILGEYLGDWNMLIWKPFSREVVINKKYLGDRNQLVRKRDSSEFFYYHHAFVVDEGYQIKIPKYFVINIFDGSVTDLSNSDLGIEENACFYTKSGNLLSLHYRELYDGQTGMLIASRCDVPVWLRTMFGFDDTGAIYFADLDGSNFRKFEE